MRPGRPTRITASQYRMLMEVRAARAAIPSNRVLARRLKLPVGTVASIISRGLKTFEKTHGS